MKPIKHSGHDSAEQKTIAAEQRRLRMFIDYKSVSTNGSSVPIPAKLLFDGRLEKYGVVEELESMALRGTDGILGAKPDADGTCSSFQHRASSSTPRSVLDAIEKEFHVKIVDGHDPLYWGFKTEAEFSAWLEEINEDEPEDLYEQLCSYCRGRPHNLKNVDLETADIAAGLAKIDESLLEPSNREFFLLAIAAFRAGGGRVSVGDALKICRLARPEIQAVEVTALNADPSTLH